MTTMASNDPNGCIVYVKNSVLKLFLDLDYSTKQSLCCIVAAYSMYLQQFYVGLRTIKHLNFIVLFF